MLPSTAAAYQGGEPGFEFLEHERFGQKIVRAFMEGAHSFGQRVPRGQHQNRCAVVAGSHFGEQCMPIHARQAEVEDNGIEFFQRQAAFGKQAVVGPVHDEARVAGEAAGQPVRQVGFVFDQQNAHGGDPVGWWRWESMFWLFLFFSL